MQSDQTAITSKPVPDRPLDEIALCEKAFSQAEYAINITDKNGILVKVNQAYLRLYKFADESDILGHTQRLIRSPQTPKGVYKHMWDTILAGETWRGELSNLAQDGSEVFIHLTITPIREEGNIIGYMGFSLDRSQQVMLERQLFHANKLVVLGTLGASLAHELNNPLASILLDAEYIRELFDSPNRDFDVQSALSAADSVIKGAERMKKVVEHLLNYSRKETESLGIFSLLDLVEDSFLFMDKQLKNRGIQLEYQIEEGIYVQGNRTQLESVIHNLLSNSRDAFDTFDPAEKLISIKATDCGGNLLMEYTDNAGGISADVRPYIFDPFFTTKKETDGTGLGLSISKKIITEHGGQITCQSESDKTLFRIELPIAKPSA